MGMTQEATGNWCCTPVFPYGVSERTVRNRQADKREAYDRCLFRIGAAFKREKEAIQEISRTEYREKLAKMRGLGLAAKKAALHSGIDNPTDPALLGLAVRVAESMENREFGMAKQVVEASHDGRVDHFIWTSDSPRQLMAQEMDMRESEALLRSLPSDVLEAEVVTDA
jgi:hypothetical protein